MIGRSGYGPGPAHPEAYEYVLGLHKSLIAWEFLRRSEDYARHYAQHSGPYDHVTERKAGNRTVRVLQQVSQHARPFGLLTFVEPGLRGDDAPVFWLPETYEAVLRMRVTRADPNEKIKSPIRVDYLPCRIWLLMDPNRTQHVLLSERLRAIQFACDGPLVMDPDVNLVLEVQDRADWPITLKTFGQLTEFYDGFLSEKTADQTEQQTAKWQRMLMAYDGKQQGMTDREIAEAFYGEQEIATEWDGRDGPLRARTRRLISNAGDLVDGGYRRVLRGR
ncbi:DUF2285 domain-containing protein [Parvularcula oceani]|uniref:DUF2285 domain-containing protein n=1 Tax=Parvularcula oceani TaxID=1247963 RepID=UPI0004E0E494|nr:DUF2285 domain-containing protein [Parvularcula oceani]